MSSIKECIIVELSWGIDSLLSKSNEVFVVSVDVRELDVNQQQNLEMKINV